MYYLKLVIYLLIHFIKNVPTESSVKKHFSTSLIETDVISEWYFYQLCFEW